MKRFYSLLSMLAMFACIFGLTRSVYFWYMTSTTDGEIILARQGYTNQEMVAVLERYNQSLSNSIILAVGAVVVAVIAGLIKAQLTKKPKNSRLF